MLPLYLLILTVLCGYGMAIALVEMKRKWPVRKYRVIIKWWLKKINRRLPKMLECSVCTSFWTTLISEIIITIAISVWSGHITLDYWRWPLSGFITVGLTWTTMDILNSIASIADGINKRPL